MNKLLYILYTYLNYKFTITADFQDPILQYLSFIVGSVLCIIIDKILCIVAYQITGDITSEYDGYSFRSAVHWTVRSLLLITIMVLGLTGIYKVLLIDLTQNLYTIVQNLCNKTMNDLTNALIPEIGK